MPSLSEETNGRVERLMPGATIGIIGGGQLGRMMRCLPAIWLPHRSSRPDTGLPDRAGG